MAPLAQPGEQVRQAYQNGYDAGREAGLRLAYEQVNAAAQAIWAFTDPDDIPF